jgi:lysosomal alpha-glucosidase
MKAATSDFSVEFTKAPFGLTVHRKSTGVVLFDTTVAPLIYADQFLQLSTALSSELLYGLGEHKNPLLYNTSFSWQRLTLWARDQSPILNSNLYGSHPFYLNVEKDANVHGAFLLNSNAMDIDIQPLPALTFRAIGGILDFYVFTGPSANQVVEQYIEVIGRPQLPPYWALGFHLCRFDYNSVEKLQLVIRRNRDL